LKEDTFGYVKEYSGKSRREELEGEAGGGRREEGGGGGRREEGGGWRMEEG
jgi:hypothetical protein